MKLADMTVGAYVDLMASDAPAPGGGSASALCGAQGAGLVGKRIVSDTGLFWFYSEAATFRLLSLIHICPVPFPGKTCR